MKRKLRAKFILASSSPRRRQLLADAGYQFDIASADIDEDSFRNLTDNPIQYTKLLAKEKALAVAKNSPGALVLGSDTVVFADGEIVGKAKDADHARAILKKLFSQPHQVITGIAIIKADENVEILESDTTRIFPKGMTDQQIEEYIRSGEWQNKAGAYGIQDSGDEFIDYIEGSFSNVVGLPMELVNRLLDQFISNQEHK